MSLHLLKENDSNVLEGKADTFCGVPEEDLLHIMYSAVFTNVQKSFVLV